MSTDRRNQTDQRRTHQNTRILGRLIDEEFFQGFIVHTNNAKSSHLGKFLSSTIFDFIQRLSMKKSFQMYQYNLYTLERQRMQKKLEWNTVWFDYNSSLFLGYVT